MKECNYRSLIQDQGEGSRVYGVTDNLATSMSLLDVLLLYWTPIKEQQHDFFR